jgi:DNA-binding NtrC family response regulator
MERIVLLEECDVICPHHLSQKVRGSSSLTRARGLVGHARALADVERQHIERVLRETDGNRTRAAEILGITRQTLLNKLKSWEESEDKVAASKN